MKRNEKEQAQDRKRRRRRRGRRRRRKRVRKGRESGDLLHGDGLYGECDGEKRVKILHLHQRLQ